MNELLGIDKYGSIIVAKLNNDCDVCGLFHDLDQYGNLSYVVADSSIVCKDCASFDDLVVEITEPDQVFKVKDMSGVEVPSCFSKVETLFCDSTGFGSESEPALTQSQAKKRVAALLDEHGSLYGAITDIGQFQVYVTLWQKVG